MESNPIDIYTTVELKKLVFSNEVNADIIIREGNIKSLENIEKVNGLCGFCDSIVNNLGNLKKVVGDFFISIHTVYSDIKSLGNLEFIDGDLCLRYSNVTDLGALKKVGGNINLRDTNIKELGLLEFVGGDLHLPKKIEKTVDLSKILVNGQTRFWNDSKTKKEIIPKSEMGFMSFQENIPYWTHRYFYSYNDIREANSEQLRFYNTFKKHFLSGNYIDLHGNNNYAFVLFYDLLENYNSDIKKLKYNLEKLSKYYPKTKSYGEDTIIRELEKFGNIEDAWELLYQKDHIIIKRIIEYEKKLNRELLDSELMFKISGYSYLSEFGQKNINNIKPFVEKRLEIYKKEKGVKFFDLFVQDGEPIKTKRIENKENNNSWLSFFDKQTSVIVYEYNPSYYEDFFLSHEEYEFYKSVDDSQRQSGFIKDYTVSLPHLVNKAIINQCKLIIKQAEDLFRESIGMPKIGEGWISETELFYKISNHFKDEEIIHHASPKWLGQQHLDIYIPKWNIGIEYQGTQHYEPIDFFGGQEAFEKTVERDKRKKDLCEKHNCCLIYVDEGYDFHEISNKIEEIIQKNKNNYQHTTTVHSRCSTDSE